ncbi:MAG: hypothetical protein U9Q76_01605 [candidate division WOR-3 bacterium]|nr:hypothetical protein [candidate division WOR-3 bacterium]
MASLAIVSFDLKNPLPDHYGKMAEALGKYGFCPFLKSSAGEATSLPSTTYARESKNAPDRDWVEKVLLWAAPQAGARLGKYLILVCSGSWEWKIG